MVVLTAIDAYRAALARALCAGLLFWVRYTFLLCIGAACGRSQIAPTGTQESNLIRVAAQLYLRRDPFSETAHQRHPRMGFERVEDPSWGFPRGKAPWVRGVQRGTKSPSGA